ncbi:MAG: MFS transporter [Promethearchaeota archaeon]
MVSEKMDKDIKDSKEKAKREKKQEDLKIIREFERLQESNWKEYYLFIQGFFYFAQGAVVIVMAMLPVFMQVRMGISPAESIALQSVIQLPWYIKILYGILSDTISFKKHGRRRPYIFIAGILAIITSIIEPHFTSFSVLFVLTSIGLSFSLAFADSIIDSLSVDVTPKNRRFLMEGVSWGARGLGASISGILFGWLANNIGWEVAFLIPGILLSGSCIMTILYKEPPIVNPEKVIAVKGEDYRREFKKGTTWSVTIFLIISGAGIAVLTVFSTFLKQEAGLDIENVGAGLSFLAMGQFIGAILTGILGEKSSVWKMLVVMSSAYIIMIASLIIVPFDNMRVLYITIVVLGAVNGSYEAIQMRIAMEFSVGKIAGTMYNWFMSITNIGQIALGAVIIAQVSESIGYRLGLQISSLFLLAAVFIGYFTIRSMNRHIQDKKDMDADDQN